MFWSGNAREIDVRAMLGASIIGVTFGATHFIAWNSEFPSRMELLLWRVSAIALTALPLNVTIFYGIMEMKLANNMWAMLVSGGVILLAPLTSLLYLFTRIATLVIAFTTLRALPADAFKTVDWTTFIPHL
jgi:hypothetical protein